MKRGDWIKFRTGDRVYDAADERFVGRVTSIRNGVYADVVWEDSGWKSEGLRTKNLRRADG